MKNKFVLFNILFILAIIIVGCQDKEDISNDREKAVDELNEYCLKYEYDFIYNGENNIPGLPELKEEKINDIYAQTSKRQINNTLKNAKGEINIFVMNYAIETIVDGMMLYVDRPEYDEESIQMIRELLLSVKSIIDENTTLEILLEKLDEKALEIDSIPTITEKINMRKEEVRLFLNGLLNEELNSYQRQKVENLVNQKIKELDRVSTLDQVEKIYTDAQNEYDIITDPITSQIEEEINDKISDLILPETTITDINLPTSYKEIDVSWQSNAISYITNDGKVNRDIKDRNVKLTAIFTYKNVSVVKEFYVKVLKYSSMELLQIVSDTIFLPEETNQNLSLIIYHDYDIVATWSSNNEDIISSNGQVTLPEKDTVVTLTVKLMLGEEYMEKNFEVNVLSKYAGKMHQIIKKSNDFDFNKFVGVSLKNNKLVLNEGINEGYYESEIINTMAFNELVASWAAISSKNSTVEIQVKVSVDGVWSDYITYYPWGFGLENKCYDQKNSLIKLSTDEVIVLNSKYADAIIFKAILRRTSSTNESPQLSLVSFALNNPSYTYKVDITDVPKKTIYDLPKLYQGEVPTIGNSICSPTTSTMLLKYKGEDFSEFDEFEHRYIANKFKDYGNDIFGNWVYNTVGISSFGYDSYVARMYSIEELILHLVNVGPVGLSVKGQMTSDQKDYYTAGHLIVCVGYRYDDLGNLYIVCNDPNVPSVLCEYTETVMKNTWRNVAYIVE